MIFLAELTLFITKAGPKSIPPLDFCLDSVYNYHFFIQPYSNIHFAQKNKNGDELTKLGDEW